MNSQTPYRCSLKYLWLGLQDIVKTGSPPEQRGLAYSVAPPQPVAYVVPFLVVACISVLVSHYGRTAMSGIKYFGSITLAITAVVTAVAISLALPTMLAYRGWQAIQRTCKRGWEVSCSAT